MQVEEFGTVIRVHDLNLCRIFYQQLLNLDEPEVNSTFLVRFRLAPGATLSLEKCDAPYLEHSSSATAFSFSVKDLKEAKALLESAKLPYDIVETCGPTGEILRGGDPEGNIFYITD